jgi:hypothetical protein
MAAWVRKDKHRKMKMNRFFMDIEVLLLLVVIIG